MKSRRKWMRKWRVSRGGKGVGASLLTRGRGREGSRWESVVQIRGPLGGSIVVLKKEIDECEGRGEMNRREGRERCLRARGE
jgi:hypothetical protein